MPSKIVIYRLAASLLWAMALWHSWTCRGLFVDGSAFVVEIVRRDWFFDFYDPRLYAMILGQIPVLIAVKLGVTDLHWLARLLSLGLFGLPTIFYHAALHRARHDDVLMGAVLAAVAIVFFTTSFFIVGEYNTIYGIAMMVAVRLATAERLSLQDGIVLALTGILAIRTYEAAVHLGPLLAAMVCWRLWVLRDRQPVQLEALVTGALYLVAVGGFIAGCVVAYNSIVYPFSESHLDESINQIHFFWQNMQFMLSMVAALTLGIWALLKPADLLRLRPYLWAGVWIVVLALSPLLAVGDNLVRPLAKSQYVARALSGGLIAGIVITIWIYASRSGHTFAVMKMLRVPEVGGRFLAFTCALFLGMLPSDLYLTATWSGYMNAFIATVQGNRGIVAFEDSPLSTRPHNLLVENWTLPSASLVLRAKEGDGIVVPPRDFTDWQPFKAAEWHPDLGRFFWRK